MIAATNTESPQLRLIFNTTTGRLTAGEFYAASDIALKTNITTITNSLDIINQLRGVKFKWKSTNKTSIGIIAQELEAVLPELVSSEAEFKSVSYNGIIGLLLEAIKEQSQIIENFKIRIALLENK